MQFGSRLFVTLVGTLGFLFSATVQGQEKDWTRFRGPNGSGVGAAQTAPDLGKVVWKKAIPGNSSPILVGDRMYLTSSSNSAAEPNRQLLCLKKDSGDLLWSKDIPSKLPEQPRVRDDHGYASNTPAADDKNVFAFFGKSGVFAFDPDGKELWQADVGSGLNEWGSAASLLLWEDLVIVNASVESGSLVALDRTSGKEVWRARGIRESWNTPIVAKNAQGQPELVLAIAGKVLGFNPRTGDPLWSCNTDIPWYMVPSLLTQGDVVYCIGGRGDTNGALAVQLGGKGDVTRSHRQWFTRKGSNVPTPILHEGHLYWMHDVLGIAYCAKADTGKIVYEKRVDGADQIYASPVMAGGKIFYLDRRGRFFVVAARPEYELLATINLGERAVFNSTPALTGGRMLVRSEKTLYCLGE